MSERSTVRQVSSWIVLALWLLPLAWLVVSAFIPTEAFVGSGPMAITLSNFTTAFALKDWQSAWLSSAISATVTTVLVLHLAIPCAYGIARWPSRAEGMMGLLIGTRILPPASTIVAYLILASAFHWLDTWALLVATGIVLQLGWVTAVLAMMLSPYSTSLEDWLVSQGVGPVRAAMTAVSARARGPIIVLGVICWLFQWGEFFYATTLTGGGRSQTVSVLVGGFSTGQDIQWGPMFAACILSAAPVIVAMIVCSALLTGMLRRIDRRNASSSAARGGADV